VAQFYDLDAFRFTRHDETRVLRGGWPITTSFPDLKALGTHGSYHLQFVQNAPFTAEAALRVSFIADTTLRSTEPNSNRTLRGQKTVTLRPLGDSFLIVAEEEFQRAPAPPGSPRHPLLELGVPGAAKHVVFAERACSRVERGVCWLPGALVLIQGTGGALVYHLTEVPRPGEFVDDDPDRFFLETNEGESTLGVSFKRDGQVLALEYGFTVVEGQERIRNWRPIAGIGMGSATPVPLWCLPLHADNPEPKLCTRKRPSL
jgi:hypothetical protein